MYEDDIIVTRNDKVENKTLKRCLAKEFVKKDLGRSKYFLGTEVARSRR